MTSVAGLGLVLVNGAGVSGAALAQSDSLPSWNDTANKQAILSFVQAVTTEGSPDFVAPSERVAVFDNDGTLWVESPIYTQLVFAMDRVRALAPDHPEWATTQPFQAVLEGDLAALSGAGEKGLIELIMATHAGMSTDAFEAVVADRKFKGPLPHSQLRRPGLIVSPRLPPRRPCPLLHRSAASTPSFELKAGWTVVAVPSPQAAARMDTDPAPCVPGAPESSR